MSLQIDYAKPDVAMKNLEAASSLPRQEARKELATLLESQPFNPKDRMLFRQVLAVAMEQCYVPIQYISDDLGSSSVSTVERWESGQSEPHEAMISSFYRILLRTLSRQDLPTPFDEEQSIRKIGKMRQLSLHDSRKQLDLFLKSYAFDPHQRETFKEIMSLAINHCGISPSIIGHNLNLMPSTIHKWISDTGEPLSRTRRKTFRILPLLLQGPVPTM